jgi:hypothetical protein
MCRCRAMSEVPGLTGTISVCMSLLMYPYLGTRDSVNGARQSVTDIFGLGQIAVPTGGYQPAKSGI